MVAVSLGFACCENLIYVFVYARGNVNVEMSVLFMRSLFPVHPLAAAIQSIGVVKRDLEGMQQHYSIGKILLPAILLHGTFDFSLMLISVIGQHSNNDEDNDNDEEIISTNILIISLICLGVSILVVLIGICYYFKVRIGYIILCFLYILAYICFCFHSTSRLSYFFFPLHISFILLHVCDVFFNMYIQEARAQRARLAILDREFLTMSGSLLV
jgi:magnesium-transporting ATPase (P-type)